MKTGKAIAGNNGLTRREFFKTTALISGTDIVAQALSSYNKAAEAYAAIGDYPLDKPENMIYSVCLQCHTSCPI